MATVSCPNCGRPVHARRDACRWCGYDRYAARREGLVADTRLDRAGRRARTVLFVLSLPFLGIGLQFVIGMMVLIVPIFIGALAGGEGAIALLGMLVSVVFGPIGYALAALFTLAMLYWRFETVRRLVRRT
jgi:hypothetical protein